MLYSKSDQIVDCLQDIEDSRQALVQAEKELKSSEVWIKRIKGWITADEKRLAKLQGKEIVGLPAGEDTIGDEDCHKSPEDGCNCTQCVPR